MDDRWVLPATWETHLQYLESMLVGLQGTDLTLKTSKLAFGSNSVVCYGSAGTPEEVWLRSYSRGGMGRAYQNYPETNDPRPHQRYSFRCRCDELRTAFRSAFPRSNRTTRSTHPDGFHNSASFKERQGKRPRHCVRPHQMLTGVGSRL